MCANMLESFESAFEPSVGGALGMAQDLAKAKVASARQGLTELKHLDLSGNCISSWEQIEPLGLLPNLQKLLINSNQLTSICRCQSNAAGPSLFQKLQSLSISSNQITEWRSIDDLNSYPSLMALRCQHNPLMAGIGSGEARQIFIARLATLRQFNGSEVRSKERMDSEKAYILRLVRA